jgi:YesN/AraC family two-component response regulator
MSGVDLAHIVRQEFPAIRVILASGYNQSALEGGKASAENFDLIAKPYRLSDLIKTLGAAQPG